MIAFKPLGTRAEPPASCGQPEQTPDEPVAITCVPGITTTVAPGDLAAGGSGRQVATDAVTVHGSLAVLEWADRCHLTEKKPQRRREHREENGEGPPHLTRHHVTSHVSFSVPSVFSVVNQKEHHEARRKVIY